MAERNPDARYLGTGWAFPPRFDRRTGPAMVSGLDDIREALWVLIATQMGERVLLPTFGTNLDTFETMSLTVRNNIRAKIDSAITYFEPRIKVSTIDVTAIDGGLQGELEVRIDYEVPSVNVRSNMVFPFYLHEGNLVRLLPEPAAGRGD